MMSSPRRRADQKTTHLSPCIEIGMVAYSAWVSAARDRSTASLRLGQTGLHDATYRYAISKQERPFLSFEVSRK